MLILQVFISVVITSLDHIYSILVKTHFRDHFSQLQCYILYVINSTHLYLIDNNHKTRSFLNNFNGMGRGNSGEQMTQSSGSLDVLPKDQGSVPSTYIVPHKNL